MLACQQYNFALEIESQATALAAREIGTARIRQEHDRTGKPSPANREGDKAPLADTEVLKRALDSKFQEHTAVELRIGDRATSQDPTRGK
jgi:hypothetical protein